MGGAAGEGQPAGSPGAREPQRGTAALVVLAGGSGTRMGLGVNKAYVPLAARAVVAWSLALAREVAAVGHCLLVIRSEDADAAAEMLRRDVPDVPVEVVTGGVTRHESEEAALALLADRVASRAVRVIAIHDGARPLAGAELLAAVIAEAEATGGAVPMVPAGVVVPLDGALPGRGSRLVRVQTPQAFRAPELLAAYAAARAAGEQGTDTASTVERHSTLTVRAIRASARNLKITYPEDLRDAERLLATSADPADG